MTIAYLESCVLTYIHPIATVWMQGDVMSKEPVVNAETTVLRAEETLAEHKARGQYMSICTQGCGTYPCDQVMEAQRLIAEASPGPAKAP